MLLAFDIGNTNIVVGCFSGEDLRLVLRLKTDPNRTVDEYAAILLPLFERRLGQDCHFSGSIISSVVPPVTPDIVRLISDTFELNPTVVGPGVKTGISVNTTEPGAVGSDRIVNSVAVRAVFGTPALVIDFGTATTFDYVSTSGSYEGGVIIPGVTVSLTALSSHTAKLPRIELAWPDKVIGKSTISAMQSGAVIGYTDMIDGLIDRIIQEEGPIQHIIATGGLGKLFAQHSRRIRRYDADLTLHGLRVLADLNLTVSVHGGK